MLGKQQVCLHSHASKRFSLNPTSSHYMYVNGACVYVLCFQYRTDRLQHLPPYKSEWCMCLHALLSVQDRLSKSPSHSQFKQEIVVFYLSPLICLWGIKISLYLSMHPFVLTADQKGGSCPLLCCVNVSLHSRLLRSHLVHWSIFYVGTIVGILSLLISFSASGLDGCVGFKRVDFTYANHYGVQFLMVPCSYTR